MSESGAAEYFPDSSWLHYASNTHRKSDAGRGGLRRRQQQVATTTFSREIAKGEESSVGFTLRFHESIPRYHTGAVRNNCAMRSCDAITAWHGQDEFLLENSETAITIGFTTVIFFSLGGLGQKPPLFLMDAFNILFWSCFWVHCAACCARRMRTMGGTACSSKESQGGRV